MILIHRLSSFVIVMCLALGYGAAIFTSVHPLVILLGMFLVTALVLGRLQGWRLRTFSFWHLSGTPILLMLSSFGALLLIESTVLKIVLAGVVTILFGLFVEHLFSYLHVPVQYQPFTLEYLSQFFHILSVFFLATLGFGMSLFLQTPVWVLSLLFFLILLFIVYGTLWAGKIEPSRARPHAFAGAVIATEFFTALTFLPTGYYTNAAFLSLGVYVLLGLSRAHALHKLSGDVLKRYVILFFSLLLVIALTSQWV